MITKPVPYTDKLYLLTIMRLDLRSECTCVRCVGGIICVLWFGARLVVENKLSPGELSTFVIYAVYVGSNVGALAGVVSSLVQVCHACYFECTEVTQHGTHPVLSWLTVAANQQNGLGMPHSNSRSASLLSKMITSQTCEMAEKLFCHVPSSSSVFVYCLCLSL